MKHQVSEFFWSFAIAVISLVVLQVLWPRERAQMADELRYTICIALSLLFAFGFRLVWQIRTKRSKKIAISCVFVLWGIGILLLAGFHVSRPDLSLHLERAEPGGSIDLLVRNNGSAASRIIAIRACDSLNWEIFDERWYETDPERKPLNRDTTISDDPLLLALSVVSQSSLALTCNTQDYRNIPFEIIEGDRLIQPEGRTLVRLEYYPERWQLSFKYGQSIGGNDRCPIQLLADNQTALLVPPCYYGQAPSITP